MQLSDELNPDFPIVDGDYHLTSGWHIVLPHPFNRRIEDGSLVLWTGELTFWFNVWNNERKASVDELLASIRQHVSPERNAEKVERTETLTRLTYELDEPDPESGEAHPSVNGYVIAPSGYVQVSAYYESPFARILAERMIASIRIA
jgi:hypothetical protein